MGQADYYKHGDWNAICDRCGFKFKASDLRKEYTGLRVCKDCFDFRHPQEKLRVPPDDPSVPWTRTEPNDVERVAYGQEYLSDSRLNDPDMWSTTGAFEVSDGQASCDGSVTSNLCQSSQTALVVGNQYHIEVDLDEITAGSLRILVGGETLGDYTTAQTISGDITCSSTAASAGGANLTLFGMDNFAGSCSRASVRRKF